CHIRAVKVHMLGTFRQRQGAEISHYLFTIFYNGVTMNRPFYPEGGPVLLNKRLEVQFQFVPAQYHEGCAVLQVLPDMFQHAMSFPYGTISKQSLVLNTVRVWIVLCEVFKRNKFGFILCFSHFWSPPLPPLPGIRNFKRVI